MSSSTTYENLAATITIFGTRQPYTVTVPTVTDMRSTKGSPNPARITYTLAESSISAGFTLGGVVVKTPSSDISLYSTTPTQLVFLDQNTVSPEAYAFGFHYYKNGTSYYFDPVIDNEEPE